MDSSKRNPEALAQLLRLYQSESSRIVQKYAEYQPDITPDNIAIIELVKVIRMNEQLHDEFSSIVDVLSSDHRSLRRKLTKALWGR